MSLILDALKKLEREKAASRKGSVDIVPAIIHSRSSRRGPANWKLPVVIICVIAATAVATAVVVISLAPLGTRPTPAVSVNADDARTLNPSHAPNLQSDSKLIPEQVRGGRIAEVAEANPTMLPQPPPARNGHARILQQKPKPVVERGDDSVGTLSGAASDLKVSGIAWQDDRADRRAVVNGALLGEGAVVEGAKIVRIFQDRIRFSRSGETFEITVAGSPQAK